MPMTDIMRINNSQLRHWIVGLVEKIGECGSLKDRRLVFLIFGQSRIQRALRTRNFWHSNTRSFQPIPAFWFCKLSSVTAMLVTSYLTFNSRMELDIMKKKKLMKNLEAGGFNVVRDTRIPNDTGWRL
jgi:hypothetical protein